MMNDFKIKKGISSLILSFFPLVGSWAVILLMTNRSEVYIYSGIIGSFIVIILFNLIWTSSIEFKKSVIIFHRLIGQSELLKKDIKSVTFKKETYILKKENGKIYQIQTYNLNDDDSDNIRKYFKKYIKK